MFNWAISKYRTKPQYSEVQIIDGLREQFRIEIPEEVSVPPSVNNDAVVRLQAQLKEWEEKHSKDEVQMLELHAQIFALTKQSESLQTKLQQQQIEIKTLQENNEDLHNKLKISEVEKRDKDNAHKLQLDLLDRTRGKLESSCRTYIKLSNSFKKSLEERDKQLPQVDNTTVTGKRKRTNEDETDTEQRKKPKLVQPEES